MMSARGSSPKISSDTVTEPELLPSRLVAFSSMSRTPRVLADRNRSRRRIIGNLELARLWRTVRQLLLHRVAHRNPPAFDARNGAFHHDQAALNIGLHHLQIERGDPLDAEMTRHLLVLEGPARILATAGRADRTMRDRHAMAGAQAGEIPAFHAAGPALAGRDD